MLADQAPSSLPRVSIRRLTKRFGGVTVLDGVDLELVPGRVHALLGENGAGKSTLIKLLSGVLQPDEGTIELDGEHATLNSPAQALHRGIATLYQELSIVPGLTVAENIYLGRPSPRRRGLGLIDFGELDRRATALLDRLGQRLDVSRDAARLTPVGMTMTAIARALSSQATVLVLDEPTAALTDAETRQLFDVVRRLTSEGVAVLYVSHRLEEVFALADDYTVLRNGHRVQHGQIAETTMSEIVAAMIGRQLDTLFPTRPEVADSPGTTVLDVQSLSGTRAADVDLQVAPGEIVGIAGLAGSGRSEVLRIVAGAQRATSGRMVVHGRRHRPRSVADGQRAGVGYLPQERRTDGLTPDSIERNINLTSLDRLTRGRVLTSTKRSNAHATQSADRIGVRRRSIHQPVFTLSGGNQQKVVLAKVLATNPTLLLLDEPTRGVDVATKSEIYHLIRERAAAGVAALVVSSELPELLGLCDRIAVMHQGNLVGWFDPRTTTEHELLLACYRTADEHRETDDIG